MKRKYLAFDIETAKEVPGEDFNWKAHRPLGITCAALLPSDASEPIVRHGKSAGGAPAERMSTVEAASLVEELVRYVDAGCTLLTWNGLGFDLDILAEESGLPQQCRQIARNHVDMMFHVFCDRGFPVALDKAAQALAIKGKPAGMSGLIAPRLWAQGRHQEVLDYVAQDVRIALQVAAKCEQRRQFKWITRRGGESSMPLPHGWLTVERAMQLPLPDTSWMDRPLARSSYTKWLG